MPSILPYIVNSNQTLQNSGYENELAYAYLLSMSDEAPIDELVQVYYPFKVFKTNMGIKVFDLLGNTESEIPLIVSMEILDKVKELTSIDDETTYQILESCKTMLESCHNETISVKGLVDNIELQEYLENAPKNNSELNQILFQPNITEDSFYDITKSVEKTRKETTRILESHRKAEKSLQKFREQILKEHEKEFKKVQKESEKKIVELEKEYNIEIEKIDNEYNIEIDAINKEADSKISEKKDEYDKVENKRDLINDDDSDSKKQRKSQNKLLRQIEKSIEIIEKERKDKIIKIDQKNDSEKKRLIEELEYKRLEKEQEKEECKKKQVFLEEKINGLYDTQSHLIKRLEEEESNLITLVELAYTDGEGIMVPFYLYKKQDLYGYNPPIKIVDEKRFSISLRKTSLRGKIQKKVVSDTLVFNSYIEKVIHELSDQSKPIEENRKKLSQCNILDSRLNLDLLTIGLYRLHEWGWINDREYFLAQKQIVENIGNLVTEYIENIEINPMLSIDHIEVTA